MRSKVKQPSKIGTGVMDTKQQTIRRGELIEVSKEVFIGCAFHDCEFVGHNAVFVKCVLKNCKLAVRDPELLYCVILFDK